MTRRRIRRSLARGSACSSSQRLDPAAQRVAAVSPGGRSRRRRVEALRTPPRCPGRRGPPCAGSSRRPCGARRRRPRRSARSSSRGSPGGRTARARRGRSCSLVRRRLRSRRPGGPRRDRHHASSGIVADRCKLAVVAVFRYAPAPLIDLAREILDVVVARAARPHPHPPLEARPRRRDRRRRAARRRRRRRWRGGRRLQHPGHGVPAGARPLQEAQPRLRGRRLDARLHRRRRARSPIPARAPRSPERSTRSASSRASRSSRTRSPRAGRCRATGELASVAVRYSTEPQDLKKPDGEALVKAAESGERRTA